MDAEHGCANPFEEAPRDYAAHEAPIGLRYQIEAGPIEHAGLLDHDPRRSRAIKPDACNDRFGNCDGLGGASGRLAGDRQDGDSRRVAFSMFDRDDQAGTRFAPYDLARGLLVKPEKMMIDDLTDARRLGHASVGRKVRQVGRTDGFGGLGRQVRHRHCPRRPLLDLPQTLVNFRRKQNDVSPSMPSDGHWFASREVPELAHALVKFAGLDDGHGVHDSGLCAK